MVASVGTFDVHLPLTRTANPAAADVVCRVIVGGRTGREHVYEPRDVLAQHLRGAPTVAGDAT